MSATPVCHRAVRGCYWLRGNLSPANSQFQQFVTKCRRRHRSARSRLGPWRRSMATSDFVPPQICRSLLSFRIWSIHLQRGRPGRRFHLGSGFRPSDKLTWAQRAWWAGTVTTVVSNLAMCPKTSLRRREIMSDMDGSPVVAVISSLQMNCCQLTCSICLWHLSHTYVHICFFTSVTYCICPSLFVTLKVQKWFSWNFVVLWTTVMWRSH